MFAALITGRSTLELVEFPDPIPADGGVVVDIAYCGICGTDLHAYPTIPISRVPVLCLLRPAPSGRVRHAPPPGPR